jgi:hypothetical protein
VTEEVKKAQELGLFLMPYAHAPQVKPGVVEEMVRVFQDSSLVLAWNIGDDLNATHYEAVKNAAELIRKLDPRKRPVTFDAIRDEPKMAPLADMFCDYYYPLLKHDWPPARYREFLQAHARQAGERAALRPNQAFWTWVQIHTQTWYNEWVHGGTKDRFIGSQFPNPEHIRLLTYEALAAGCKGIIFFTCRFLQPDWHGRDRYAEIGVLGCEIRVLGPLLADSVPGGQVSSSEPSLHVERLDGPFGSLLILTLEREGYQFHVDEAVVRNVTLTVPDLQGASAVLLKFPEPEALAVKDGKLNLPEVELVGAVLVARNSDLAKGVAEQWRRMLPEAAEFSVEAASGLLEKSKPVFEALGAIFSSSKELPDNSQALWKEAEAAVADAQNALGAKDFEKAWVRSRAALRSLRKLQQAAWRRAVGEALPDYRKKEDQTRLCFYDLDRYYKRKKWLETAKAGPNLVENPSFEELSEGVAKGWPKPASVRDGKAERILDSTGGHSGTHCLKLISRQPTLWQGQEKDWVTIDALSTPIAVEPGKSYRLSAWVRITKDFEKTGRGAVVGFESFDKEGKTLQGGGIIEAKRVQATNGWERMEMVLDIGKEVHSAKVRLGVCGIGEALFDDVEFCELLPGL